MCPIRCVVVLFLLRKYIQFSRSIGRFVVQNNHLKIFFISFIIRCFRLSIPLGFVSIVTSVSFVVCGSFRCRVAFRSSNAGGQGWNYEKLPMCSVDVVCLFSNWLSILCSEDKPKSTLSADAKEWFPPNYVPPSQDTFYSNPENFDYYNQDVSNYEYSNYHTNHTNAPFYQGYDQVPYEQQRFSVQDRLRYHQHPEEYELQVWKFSLTFF